MPDYAVLYPGRFLSKEALPAPKVIRVVKVTVTSLENDKGSMEQKVVLSYKAQDGEGEIVWCKTNAMLTSEALGERDYDKWAGRLITIGNNPNVDFGGKKVGGIRVCGSPEMTAPKKVSIKRPRRKNPEVYMLTPTDKKGQPVTTKTEASTEEPPLDLDAPVDEATA